MFLAQPALNLSQHTVTHDWVVLSSRPPSNRESKHKHFVTLSKTGFYSFLSSQNTPPSDERLPLNSL